MEIIYSPKADGVDLKSIYVPFFSPPLFTLGESQVTVHENGEAMVPNYCPMTLDQCMTLKHNLQPVNQMIFLAQTLQLSVNKNKRN